MQAVQSPIIPIVGEWIRQHPGTISLGQGVVFYGPPPETREAVDAFWADSGAHLYKAVQGVPELTEALTRKLRAENGVPVGEGCEVLATAGANMAFMNAVLAVTDPGDEVILQTPYYFNHEMAVTIAGCQPVLVATDENHQLRPDRIGAAITPRTRAVVTVSPNNPSGAVYPETALRRVNELCRARGLYHIHDEAYEYFVYEGAEHVSPGSFDGAAAHTISLYSLSKAYGCASWRIGYQVVPAGLFESIRKIQDTQLICPPVISQHAALGALRAGRDYCQGHLAGMAAVRTMVRQELSVLGDRMQVPPAEGAFYFLLRLQTEQDPVRLTERLIREHGVAVIPGTAFGLDSGCALRVAYGALGADTVREGIGRLVRGLGALLHGGKQSIQ